MKKKIAILAAMAVVFGGSLNPASAGLIGMPINLKAAIAQHDAQVLDLRLSVEDAFVVSVLI